MVSCLGSTDQPLTHCPPRLCFSNWLPENEEEKNLQKSCIPLEIHRFPCVWAPWMQNSHQSSVGLCLWSAACSQRGAEKVATPCGDSYRCLELAGCCYPWEGARGIPLPTSLPSVPLSWGLSCLTQPAWPQLSPNLLCCDHTSWWHCRHTFRTTPSLDPYFKPLFNVFPLFRGLEKGGSALLRLGCCFEAGRVMAFYFDFSSTPIRIVKGSNIPWKQKRAAVFWEMKSALTIFENEIAVTQI